MLEQPQDDMQRVNERKVVSAEERMKTGQSRVAGLRAMLDKAKKS
jgi:ATP-dependent DNA helicase Rep